MSAEKNSNPIIIQLKIPYDPGGSLPGEFQREKIVNYLAQIAEKLGLDGTQTGLIRVHLENYPGYHVVYSIGEPTNPQLWSNLNPDHGSRNY